MLEDIEQGSTVSVIVINAKYCVFDTLNPFAGDITADASELLNDSLNPNTSN